jgi:hypothetical protein
LRQVDEKQKDNEAVIFHGAIFIEFLADPGTAALISAGLSQFPEGPLLAQQVALELLDHRQGGMGAALQVRASSWAWAMGRKRTF